MLRRIEYEITPVEANEISRAWSGAASLAAHGQLRTRSNQDRVNDIWRRIGEEMGFDHTTIERGNGVNTISAITTETDAVRADRRAEAAKAERNAKIGRLEHEIAERQAILNGIARGTGGLDGRNTGGSFLRVRNRIADHL